MRAEEITRLGDDGATVALFEKRLSSRERDEPEARARLRSEATLLAALGGRVSPRLVATGEDERGFFLRTAKVPFPTLAARLEAAASSGSAGLDAAWIERAARAAFAALAELHEAADASGPLLLVHADLSPANVAVDDAAARVILLDFDLASWRDSATRDGAFRGTVAYAAPELARGEAPTAQSDLFALAATFVHAVTGAAPRSGPSLAVMLANAAERPLLDDLPRSPAEIAAAGCAHAAIVRCLAHAAASRPTSARAVLSLLR